MKKIKVLIVDDSLIMRLFIQEMISSDPEIEVIGQAENAMDAREKIKSLNPDVITLDVEMPGMNGIQFLEKIMTLRPMPVLMLSTLTAAGAEVTLRALEIGAVDAIQKNISKDPKEIEKKRNELIAKIKMAAVANIKTPTPKLSHEIEKFSGLKAPVLSTVDVIGIGASTGGVEAITSLIKNLPTSLPPIVIVQHMPPLFTTSFAKRLDSVSQVTVEEAQDKLRLKKGHVYIAPGGNQFEIQKTGAEFMCRVYKGETVTGHMPSVDALFHSLAKNVKNAIGIILTGMGEDGAEGLLNMRKSGARTMGQNAASSVVYGMPKSAQKKGAVEFELALKDIPYELLKLCGWK